MATGFPVCPTCSLCGLHPKSETGFEQAVAAPRISASSSIIAQFSGPFNPRPADTTTSASAIVTLSFALSMEVTLVDDVVKLGANASICAAAFFSTIPNELLDTPTILIGVDISVLQNALLVNAVRFTVNGFRFDGVATTFGTYPALRPTASRGAMYLLSALALNTTTVALSFSAAFFIASAYILALKSLTESIFNTLSTP